MKKILIILIFFCSSFTAFAQMPVDKQSDNSTEKKEIHKNQIPINSIPVPKIQTPQVLDSEGKKPHPAAFYIIDDKPVSKEEYLIYLREKNQGIKNDTEN